MKRCIQTTALLLLLVRSLYGQTTTEKIVRYESLQFLDPIPYQQPFVIQGSRTILKTKADLGKLIILHEGTIVDSTFWWSSGREDRNFHFYVKGPLDFGKEYNFSFEFYTYADPIDTIERQLGKILQEQIYAEYLRLVKAKQTLSFDDVKLLADRIIEDFGKGFGSVNGGAFSKTANLKAKNDRYVSFLLNLVKRRKENEDSIRRSDEYKGAILEIFANNPGYDSIATLYFGIPASEVKKMRELDPTVTKITIGGINDFEKKLKDLSGKLGRDLRINDDEKKLIKKISNISLLVDRHNVIPSDDLLAIETQIARWGQFVLDIRTLVRKYELFTKCSEKIKLLDALLRSDVNQLNLNFKLDDSFTQINLRAKIISDNSTKPVKVEDLETVRFSPVIGFALAPMNFTQNNDWQFFGILAIKYYLGPVDKRVPKPYLVDNRWSLMAGVVANSDINYRGQKMENAGLGVKPIVGFGYDIGPLIGINMGTVLFQQPSVNPLVTQTRLRAAAFASLTIDIDLFNRLRNLFANQKYKIN